MILRWGRWVPEGKLSTAAAGRKIFFVLLSKAIVFALGCVVTVPASSYSLAEFS